MVINMPATLYGFSACGRCKDIELLEKLLLDIIPHLECNYINGYKFSTAPFNSDKTILVFCSYNDDEDFKSYPFEITATQTGASILANHIISYIENLSEKQLKQLGCAPTGYEEDYEIGWCVFIPNTRNDQFGIDSYGGDTVLAAKPYFIEYGK